MVQLKTFLVVTDKTTVIKVYCIKVLNNTKKRIANLGELIIICVNTVNMKKFINLKARNQKKYSVGTMHRALLVRTKVNYERVPGIFFKFGENNAVIVNKLVVPLSNKVYGPVFREFCMK